MIVQRRYQCGGCKADQCEMSVTIATTDPSRPMGCPFIKQHSAALPDIEWHIIQDETNHAKET